MCFSLLWKRLKNMGCVIYLLNILRCCYYCFCCKPTSREDEKKEKTALRTGTSASRNPLVSIEVLTPVRSGLTDHFLEHFEKKLETIGLKSTVIDVDKFNADVNCTDVVLVICDQHSREQANVENAVYQLRKDSFSRIFLIVLHAKKNYRILPSKASLEENEFFQRFNNRVDIAFSKEDGIYDCDTNTSAFQAIRKVLIKS